jgi:hypothetical protein
MDDKIKSSGLCATTTISNEANESFDEVLNDIEWGENGSTTQLLNIATTIKDVRMKVEVNVQKQKDQKC